MRIEKYCSAHKAIWDSFVASSKNGTFLFHRDYMDYHADRFQDHSILFFDERDRLIALLPASLQATVINSHGGLSYGGVIFDEQMRIDEMLQVFAAMLAYMRQDGITRLVYKAVPYIYHRFPADEDLYALFRNGARLFRRDASSVIYLPDRLRYSENRRRGIKRAERHALAVEESCRFREFFGLAEQVLSERHNVRPVHSWQEMSLLAHRFPDNIKLYEVSKDNELLAGVIAYVTETAVHAQYMASSLAGRETGALDMALDYLVRSYQDTKRYLSFGVSTEDQGHYLNCGLINQKEQFGARCIVHDFYEVDIA